MYLIIFLPESTCGFSAAHIKETCVGLSYKSFYTYHTHTPLTAKRNCYGGATGHMQQKGKLYNTWSVFIQLAKLGCIFLAPSLPPRSRLSPVNLCVHVAISCPNACELAEREPTRWAAVTPFFRAAIRPFWWDFKHVYLIPFSHLFLRSLLPFQSIGWLCFQCQE